ncbi:MAG: hypothetical protein AAF757_02060 [Cyanobacteria bacterium P01_D01_bin.116]
MNPSVITKTNLHQDYLTNAPVFQVNLTGNDLSYTAFVEALLLRAAFANTNIILLILPVQF